MINDGESEKSGRGQWIYLRDGSKLVELMKEEVGVEMGGEE